MNHPPSIPIHQHPRRGVGEVLLRGTLFVTCVLTAAACTTVGPEFETPTINAARADADLGGKFADGMSREEPAQSWWRALGDPLLNALVDEAFLENRDLRKAAANVAEARAALGAQRVNQRPTGEVSAAYERRRLSGAALGDDSAEFSDSDLISVGVGAAWELDFFGRVRRQTEAAKAEYDAAIFLERDAQSLVAAETARAYIDFRGAALQLRVAKRNLELQKKTTELTRIRLADGLGSQLDLSRAEAQALTTEAGLPPLEAQKTSAANRLATLTGASAIEVEKRLQKTDAATLPRPPQALPIGNASQLLQRRADIRAAERSLAAATARIGVAKADFFPRITLLGSANVSAQSLAGLGDGNAFGFGIGPSISWSGFDRVKVQAQVDIADARTEAALATYEQTVLLALEETRTAMSAYGREVTRFGSLRAAGRSARQASDLARTRFNEGADDFIDVLDAEARQLATEAALAQSRTAVVRNYIDIYRALGAGWVTPPEPVASLSGG